MQARHLLAVPALLLLYACSSGKGSPAAGADPNNPGTTDDDAGAVDNDGGTNNPAVPCGITQKGTSGLVLQGTVLAPSGPIADGEVLVDAQGIIQCADKSCASATGYADATIVHCPASVISPSLINGHDHTEYATRGPITHNTTRWAHRNGWRTGAGGEQQLPKVTRTTDQKVVAAAEMRFIFGGATAINGSGGVAGLARNLATGTQLEGLKGAPADFDTFPLGDSNGTVLTTGCNYPSVRTATAAFKGGAYSPHISEGINAGAENEMTCLSSTLIRSDTAIIHAVGINARDVDTIAKAHAKVIWSARTNIDLYGNTAPVTELKAAGVTIALGTDWTASGSMNMLRELKCVDSLNQKYFNKAFSDQELWEMATKNAAAAFKFETQIGQLKQGMLADIAVFSAANSKDYRAVIDAGVEDVMLVMRGGKVLFGDEELVAGLAQGCSAIDVCGVKKQACVDAPNISFADVTGAAGNTYPLFFCKNETPKDEPSCVPYRDSYPNGTSATDRDGDGVPDAQDNCPDVFNPPRPMDGTTQADVDNDGAGDACDAKPLDAASH